jgi:hypothetical protein
MRHDTEIYHVIMYYTPFFSWETKLNIIYVMPHLVSLS